MSETSTSPEVTVRDLELHFGPGVDKVVPFRHAVTKGTRKNHYWGVLKKDADTGERFFSRMGVKIGALGESLPEWVTIVDPETGQSRTIDLEPGQTGTDETPAGDRRPKVSVQKKVTLPGIGLERMFRASVSQTKDGSWNLTISANNLGGGGPALDVEDL